MSATALARLILIVAAFCLALSEVPARSQPQGPFVDPDASAVQQQQLLQQQHRIEGRIVIPDQKARVLIQPAGRVWDYFHEVILHWLGAIVIAGTLAGLTLAYLILGRIRITAGRSGRKVPRFTGFERFSHWLTAVSFVVLGVTGLNITFGKFLVRPLIGSEAFGALSEGAKYVHNYISFSFVVGLALIVALWIKDNIPDRTDIEWFRQGGGFIRSRHAPARRFNAGEKLVFWGALGAGILVTISGFLLLFPFYVTNIFGMQVAQGVHAVIAVLFVAMILGHIYIGTAGMEGAFEAMSTGEVDYNWAKEHHDLWLKELSAKGRAGHPAELSAVTPAE
jgi:formate dehydrogenase subunit gamma